MSYGYSKTTNAFYDMSREAAFIAAGTWPGDVQAVPADVVAEFMQSPPAGTQRVAGSDGLPVWADVPPPSADDIIHINQLNKNLLLERAAREINLLTDATDPAVMGDDVDPADVTLLNVWRAYRVRVSRVTDLVSPVWPPLPVQ